MQEATDLDKTTPKMVSLFLKPGICHVSYCVYK